MRYVERNALRAGLVDDSQDWPWGSLAWRNGSAHRCLLTKPPIALPRNWTDRVNAPQTPSELEALRACVNRQRPFGNDEWVDRTAVELGLESSLRPVGRPPKASGKKIENVPIF
jgi:putative transposase